MENDINIKYSSAKICFTRAIWGAILWYSHCLRHGNFASNYYLCIYHFIYVSRTLPAVDKVLFFALLPFHFAVWMLSMSLQCVALVRGKW